jgi:hypothetical protein
MRDVQGRIRQEVVRGMADAAAADEVSILVDAAASVSRPGLLLINAPVVGIDELDFTGLLEGRPVLEDAPIMYWYLAGDVLSDDALPLEEGLYTVVADQQQGAVALKDARGKTVAEGDLHVGVEPQPSSPGVAKFSVSGGITTFDVNIKKKHIKVCGNVTVEVGGAKLTVEGCVEVDW